MSTTPTEADKIVNAYSKEIRGLRERIAELEAEREHWRLSSVCREAMARAEKAEAACAEMRGALENVARLYEDCATTATTVQMAGRLYDARCVARQALSTPAPTSTASEKFQALCADFANKAAKAGLPVASTVAEIETEDKP